MTKINGMIFVVYNKQINLGKSAAQLIPKKLPFIG